ncbi:MAG: Na+/H+ antiporter subunit D [Phycisphaerales bacterium]|nr:Na+/H+ antiporter subunit D [Phycisphaerales bacterium]
MHTMLVLPILIPLLTAALSLLLQARPAWRVWLGVGGAAVHLASGVALLVLIWTHGVQATQVGNWPAPFGITLVADLFSALMVLIATLMGFVVALYSLGDIGIRRQRFGYFALLQILLMGVCGSFLTGDLFNLFVWFEVMLITSFVLLALGGERAQMEGALKYVTLNLFSSAVFLSGVGILYGSVSALNMADLAQKLPVLAESHPHLVLAVSSMFLLSFGIKAGVFPLFFWLPASYHTPPPAVSAIFAGLLTKVGVYALLRVFTLVFPLSPTMYGLILAVAALTMVTGVFGAVTQMEMRRILSFHIISQIGYMVMGLGLLCTPDPAIRRLALAAAVFYIIHHIIVKTNLFLVSGTVRALRGTDDLKPLGGLAVALPWLAVLFLIPAFSLAGVPPLSGFWAKLAVLQAGLQAEAYWAVFAALFAGLLTLLSMVKIWNEAFWKVAPERTTDSVPHLPPSRRRLTLLVVPSILLAALTLFIGVYPQGLFRLAERAAEQMLNPTEYITAVGVPPYRPHLIDAPPADPAAYAVPETSP